MMDPKEISDWQHEEFYRYVAQAYDKPRYTLHYRTDAPLNIRSIFYVPEGVRGNWESEMCLCFIIKYLNTFGFSYKFSEAQYV